MKPEMQDVDPKEKLGLIKNLVANGDYHYSRKVRNFIEKGCYETGDLEMCILTVYKWKNAEEETNKL